MKKRVRKILAYGAVFVFTAFIFWCAHVFLRGADAVILMYHSVGAPGGEKAGLDIPEETFARQMDFLSRRGYRVIRLSELAAMLRRGERIPPKTVVITFDDGYENNYTQAFPVLKKYGFPATIFVIGSRLGDDYPVAPGVEVRLATLGQLKEMAASGLVDIGSHTWTHPYLPDIRQIGILLEEIVDSRGRLEQMIGAPVKTLSYPLGGFSEGIKQLAGLAGYEAAVTIHRKDGPISSDIYALKRIKVTKASRNLMLFSLMTSGYYLRMKETAH